MLGAGGLSEPTVAAELGVLLPERATLFVASSMPVRDIESFWPVRSDPPRVLCNRGANGIDGTVSSAFGAAAAGPDPTVLLIGDVALAHDIGGLLAARRLQLDLTIVLIDNGGGGIFDFLPVAHAALARSASIKAAPPIDGEQPAQEEATPPDNDAVNGPREDLYTRHIATPTGLDFAHAAAVRAGARDRHRRARLPRGARAGTDARPRRAGIIEVRTDRSENVALHRRAWEAVAGVLDETGMRAEGECPPASAETGMPVDSGMLAEPGGECPPASTGGECPRLRSGEPKHAPREL